jgi:aryl-alcohol dehydrogenase-like predicted oxidoreductase
VAPLCLGGNVFGWTVDEKTGFALLDAFVDAGFSFIDTADVYSGGVSEQITGQALKNLKVPRENVVIATKVFGETGTGANTRGKRQQMASASALVAQPTFTRSPLSYRRSARVLGSRSAVARRSPP